MKGFFYIFNAIIFTTLAVVWRNVEFMMIGQMWLIAALLTQEIHGAKQPACPSHQPKEGGHG